MRDFVRPVAAMLGLAVAISLASNGDAFAQAKQQMAPPAKQAPAQAAPQPAQQPELKQIALTDKQVERAGGTWTRSPTGSDNAPPDPKIDAKLDDVARGTARPSIPHTVVDNISLVLGGVDPATKKYVGAEAVIKTQIAQITADKKMSAKDKKDALADLNEALKQPQPAIEQGNIDLVIKYYTSRKRRRRPAVTAAKESIGGSSMKPESDLRASSFLEYTVFRSWCACASWLS